MLLHPFLTRITSEEAFDAYQKQAIANVTGDNDIEGVLIVDVRTPEELYWAGQPAQVNKMHFNNDKTEVPIDFKTILDTAGKGDPKLKYKLDKSKRYLKGKKKGNKKVHSKHDVCFPFILFES